MITHPIQHCILDGISPGLCVFLPYSTPSPAVHNSIDHLLAYLGSVSARDYPCVITCARLPVPGASGLLKHGFLTDFAHPLTDSPCFKFIFGSQLY